jgi:A/G-specific adenine glycosylase
MEKKLSKREIRKFKKCIWDYYHTHGRHELPWRKTKNPYRILVSEIMLQQTQVERVIPKYKRFIKSFPSVISLKKASLAEIIAVWQGLGYNRRAVFLCKIAGILIRQHKGRVPSSPDVLKTLPGIGEYTASAIAAFAYDKPLLFIDTNIRSVYIHFFLSGKKKVHDAEIRVLLEQTIDNETVRDWYYALMDYGTMLKKRYRDLNRQSVQYSRQSRFEGSTRQIRGRIIRLLSEYGPARKQKIRKSVELSDLNLDDILDNLRHDGLIRKNGTLYTIA